MESSRASQSFLSNMSHKFLPLTRWQSSVSQPPWAQRYYQGCFRNHSEGPHKGSSWHCCSRTCWGQSEHESKAPQRLFDMVPFQSCPGPTASCPSLKVSAAASPEPAMVSELCLITAEVGKLPVMCAMKVPPMMVLRFMPQLPKNLQPIFLVITSARAKAAAVPEHLYQPPWSQRFLLKLLWP